MRRCPNKHKNSWILGGHTLWCPDCGAIRPNRPGRIMWAYPDGWDKAYEKMRKWNEK